MQLSTAMRTACRTASTVARQNACWLQEQMSPYFFQAMADEPEALGTLVREMSQLQHNRHLILADRDKRLIMACVDEPGSLFNSLQRVNDRELSYAMFSHSLSPMPNMSQELEVQRFEFDAKSHTAISDQTAPAVPAGLKRSILNQLTLIAPDIPRQTAEKLLTILWRNNPERVTQSP